MVWVMIPAGATGAVIENVAELLEPGDIIIDGGNSRYHEDIKRAKALEPKGIHYLDIGTSGGVFGPTARLLPDDRREQGPGRLPGAAAEDHRSGLRVGPAHPWPHR